MSNFSLNFPAIGQSVSGEARSKVALRSKGYAWAPILESFEKFRKVGVFSYLIESLFRSLVNGFVCVRPKMAMDSRFHKVEPMLGERAAHRQPIACLGTVIIASMCLLDRTCPREFA